GKAQPVIMAAQRVAFDLAHRQRQVTMTAAILERDGRTAGAAIEDDRLTEDHARQGTARDLPVPGGDVPAVPKIHWRSPARHASCSKVPCLNFEHSAQFIDDPRDFRYLTAEHDSRRSAISRLACLVLGRQWRPATHRRLWRK